MDEIRQRRMFIAVHGKIVQCADDTTLCFKDNVQEGLEQQTFVHLNNCVQYFNSLNLQTLEYSSKFF
ncbi:hypothetical protein J6590_007346 [Homalodisca vitripennis]|nr:hypothetical protein J6590_007346 [Homalodisca vitripennis]